MVKKILMCLVVVFIAGFAYGLELDGPMWVETETINNSGDAASIAVKTTNIYPARDKILGFSVMPKMPTSSSSPAHLAGWNTEAFATLYDTTDSNLDLTTNEIINEIEGQNGAGDDTWFPYPYPLKNQVIVRQGAWTEVVIYHIR